MSAQWSAVCTIFVCLAGEVERPPLTALPVMTSHNYDEDMTRVGVAELKARLSEHLRSVRAGRRITVVDRSTPIAELIPIQQESLEIRPARRSARNLPIGKSVLPSGVSSLAVLLEDRSKR